jgi:hypothetical protein
MQASQSPRDLGEARVQSASLQQALALFALRDRLDSLRQRRLVAHRQQPRLDQVRRRTFSRSGANASRSRRAMTSPRKAHSSRRTSRKGDRAIVSREHIAASSGPSKSDIHRSSRTFSWSAFDVVKRNVTELIRSTNTGTGRWLKSQCASDSERAVIMHHFLFERANFH